MFAWIMARLGGGFFWLGVVFAVIEREPKFLLVSFFGMLGALMHLEEADAWDLKRVGDRIAKELREK